MVGKKSGKALRDEGKLPQQSSHGIGQAFGAIKV
jgi:hypothetical protein